VVIPCLNEAETIAQLVSAVREVLPSVIVINDGSSDATAERARAAGATVLSHGKPRGKGAALRTGWSHALNSGFLWALSMDGDGQHSPEDIPRFLTRADEGDVALVSGNRMATPDSLAKESVAAMPRVRRWTNRFMSSQLSRLAGLSLPDSQCGYRLMRLDYWAKLPICTDCFEIESEVLLHFARARLGIAFVPIRIIYAREKSKIRPLRDSLRWFRWRREMRKRYTTVLLL
jgi:glycosyltransferase involved in cell wall biosynthesis